MVAMGPCILAELARLSGGQKAVGIQIKRLVQEKLIAVNGLTALGKQISEPVLEVLF